MENYNGIQDKRTDKIEKHVEIMNKEFGDFKVSNTKEHAEIKTDIKWLKYWIIIAASAGGGLPTIINRFF